jgi:surface antigen
MMISDKKDNSMAKRLINMMVIATASMWALTGCDNATDSVDATDQTSETAADPSTLEGKPAADTIDWSLVDSGTKPADPTNYKYPFAIDSQNVRDYADYFKVDAATAQHNLTVSMASNEALSKALDQLSETYVSHELTDGNEMTLIIHTTPDVAASRYDYVLSDDFAKGLILPIVIQPDGKKGDVKAHSEMAE